jgi:hypothetical protein
MEYNFLEMNEMVKKNLMVTFTVTALVSPEEYEKMMGYPAGSPENEMPPVEEWDEELPEVICTYSSEFSRWCDFFRITDRKVVSVEETDEPWDEDE